MNDHTPTLVLGGTGKTGARLVRRLTRQDVPVRVGVQRALGRAPRDFAGYARDTAATGIWDAAARNRSAS